MSRRRMLSSSSLNDEGVVVGSVVHPETGYRVTTRWRSLHAPEVLPIGAESSSAADINNLGQIVGSYR